VDKDRRQHPLAHLDILIHLDNLLEAIRLLPRVRLVLLNLLVNLLDLMDNRLLDHALTATWFV